MTSVSLQGGVSRFVSNLSPNRFTSRASSVDGHSMGMSEGMKVPLILTHHLYWHLTTCRWIKLSKKKTSLKSYIRVSDITLYSKTHCGWTNPKECLLLLSDWPHEMCVILTPTAFQFKNRGQGFGVTLGLESQSDSNLTEQDEINEPWPPRGLLTPVCLSPGSRTHSLPPQLVSPWACLVSNNQFHLDGSQNKLDPSSHERLLHVWEIVEWSVCTTYIRKYST